MHKSLAHPLDLLLSWVVTGTVIGKERKHAGIPVSQSVTGLSQHLVLYIKTPAGRAKIGTGATIDAGEGDLIPEGRIKERVDLLLPQFISRDL